MFDLLLQPWWWCNVREPIGGTAPRGPPCKPHRVPVPAHQFYQQVLWCPEWRLRAVLVKWFGLCQDSIVQISVAILTITPTEQCAWWSVNLAKALLGATVLPQQSLWGWNRPPLGVSVSLCGAGREQSHVWTLAVILSMKTDPGALLLMLGANKQAGGTVMNPQMQHPLASWAQTPWLHRLQVPWSQQLQAFWSLHLQVPWWQQLQAPWSLRLQVPWSLQLQVSWLQKARTFYDGCLC